ncbi:MAG TPA: response regulator [Solirubrobacteraceae bacterium]|jgi:two-component system chemotaxis sensor kinase CheA
MSATDEEIYELVRQESGDCLQRMETNLLALESGSAAGEEMDAILRDAHSIKGSSAMVGWQEVATLASAIEDRMEQARERGAFPMEFADPLLRAVDILARGLHGESGIAAPLVAELAGLGSRTNGEAAQPASDERPSAEQRPPATSTIGAAATVRIPAAKVDRMLDVVGETVLYHRRLEHELGSTLDGGQHSSVLDMGERLLDGLQDSVVQMRTLPLSTITARFPRAIRDLAAQEGKETEMTISGAETQLDRVILDGISETIVHVLRNAVAHGIETPEQRESVGKPRAGRIELHAEQRGGMVAIAITDDGRGVSPELLARAEQSGSLVDILAETGFSTAEEVSDAAGRGVGLDAVKLHVESLSGSLDVRSKPGRGTEVTLLLPVTLALMQVLLFEWDGHPFALPMSSVGRVVAVTDTTSLGGRSSLDIEGEAIPLSDLGELIGAGSQTPAKHLPAIILESPARRLAVACDELRGEEEVVIKGLGALLAGVPGYLGAAILGDGRIALVLDPTHLLKAPMKAIGFDRPPQAPESRPTQVLVVDDQFSARELQRSILETAGYRVHVARDGREALRQIGESADIDLVLTDVQMPEMDGFELLEAIRADKQHGSLPVVVVTTLGDEQSRRRGAEAGADAYVVKQEFDQQALLETIDRLVGM